MRARLFVSVAALVAMGACSDADLDREDHKLAMKGGIGGVTSKGGGSSTKSPDVQLSRKLGPYITCINSGAKSVTRSRARYLSWIKDKKVGPTCKERFKWGVFKLYSTMNCSTYLLRGNAKKPSLPKLEKSAALYARAVQRLKPMLDRAYRYWNKRGYKRDRCAEGKAMHPKLMATWALASAAMRGMRARVSFHNSGLQARRLARVERVYGKTHARYFRYKVVAEAKGLLAVARRALRSKEKGPGQLAPLVAEQRNYAKVIRAMNAGKPTTAYAYPRFKSAAVALSAAFGEFIDRKRSGRPYSRTEKRRLRSATLGYMVIGSFDRVLKRFNQLINAFNRVRFRRR